MFALSWDAAADEIPYAFNLPPGALPVEVRARFFLSDINDIDETAETFEIKGLLALQWQDKRYVFEPEAEGVTEKRYQGIFQFLEEYNGWWPQLVLHNGVGTIPLQSVSLHISPRRNPALHSGDQRRRGKPDGPAPLSLRRTETAGDFRTVSLLRHSGEADDGTRHDRLAGAVRARRRVGTARI